MRRAAGLTVLALVFVLAVGVAVGQVRGEVAPTLTQDEVASIARQLVGEATPLGPGAMRKLPLLMSEGEASPPVSAAPNPQVLSDILLQAADVGPGYFVISSGERTEHGAGWRAQSLRRSGKHIYYIESDGVLFVRSLAALLPDPGAADRVFDEAGKSIFEGVEEVPVPALGQRTRGGIEWGEKPYDLAAKIVMFRVRSVVGYVIVIGFEAPETMADIIPLAQIMAARASR